MLFRFCPFTSQHLNSVVVSNIFYFHLYLGKISILANIFQMGWNHQLENCEISSGALDLEQKLSWNVRRKCHPELRPAWVWKFTPMTLALQCFEMASCDSDIWILICLKSRLPSINLFGVNLFWIASSMMSWANFIQHTILMSILEMQHVMKMIHQQPVEFGSESHDLPVQIWLSIPKKLCLACVLICSHFKNRYVFCVSSKNNMYINIKRRENQSRTLKPQNHFIIL